VGERAPATYGPCLNVETSDRTFWAMVKSTSAAHVFAASVLVMLPLATVSGCGSGTSSAARTSLVLWVCVEHPANRATYQLVFETAMAPRADGRGEDFRPGVRSARVDIQVGAVEFRLEGLHRLIETG
jgi:hypothetical protein